MQRVINSFRGDYYFLSNMCPSPIRLGERVYSCVEAAFQAQKDPASADKFVGLNGYEAKKLGRTVTLRNDWTTQRVAIMKYLVREKFVQNDILRRQLYATQDATLIEGNNWGDTFWGVSNGIGQNTLGKILMWVRSELLKEGGK